MMMPFSFKPSLLLTAVAVTLAASLALPEASLAQDRSETVLTDKRIKTFVYNANDVFPVLTQFGYQTNIEFGQGETIETISLGDRVGWQVVPSGRRLYIRAAEDSARTNMTVVTNRRAYQFDLRSAAQGAKNPDELVYVARFYYPEEKAPNVAEGIDSGDLDTAVAAASTAYNFNYTYVGPDALAPTRIFDDGKSTYFKLKNNARPDIALVGAGGKEMPISFKDSAPYAVVPTTAARFALRFGDQVICVFNESAGGRPPAAAQ